MLIAGDLNVALADADVHPTMRRARAIGQRADERALLSGVIAEGMRDVVREANAEASDVFTWWPPWRDEKINNHGWRIDFVLAPAALADCVENVEILRDFGSSDHAPVAVRFGL